MSKPPVIILQHVACEGPGRIADTLLEKGIPVEPVLVYAGQRVPSTLDAASGLVVMGGPMGVYEQERFPYLRDEMSLIESALRAELPVLGVCLGSQLLAATLGARVYPGPRKEIGWYDVRLCEAAKHDTLFSNLPNSFVAFHWHGDVFDLPSGAELLASSALTKHQAFRFGRNRNAYGLLFHLEVTNPQIAEMTSVFRDELSSSGVEPANLLEGTMQHLSELQRVGTSVFERFADLVSGAET